MVELRQHVSVSDVENNHMNLNLLLIGDQAVGKTSIIERYVTKKFNALKAATTGVDFCKANYVSQSGEKCKIKIWDTVGAEKLR